MALKLLNNSCSPTSITANLWGLGTCCNSVPWPGHPEERKEGMKREKKKEKRKREKKREKEGKKGRKGRKEKRKKNSKLVCGRVPAEVLEKQSFFSSGGKGSEHVAEVPHKNRRWVGHVAAVCDTDLCALPRQHQQQWAPLPPFPYTLPVPLSAQGGQNPNQPLLIFPEGC